MIQYHLIRNEDGESNIVVFISGEAPQVAHESHPNFEAILLGATQGDESILSLFDVAKTVGEKFQRLSERVTTQHGKLFLDGVEVNNTLTEQVLRFLDEGVEDWQPLVNFFENVQANPNEHSREQLFNWLSQRDFTITRDGLIVGYKGVTSDLKSIHSGRAIVDGVEVTGQIPNAIGSIIEMPRDQVQWDPSIGCHTGLHVGTYDYASNFGRGALLEVHVNPRDVVSVPTDCDWAKVRCCRYTVVDTIDQPYTTPVLDYSDYSGYDDGWGDGEYDDYPTYF